MLDVWLLLIITTTNYCIWSYNFRLPYLHLWTKCYCTKFNGGNKNEVIIYISILCPRGNHNLLLSSSLPVDLFLQCRRLLHLLWELMFAGWDRLHVIVAFAWKIHQKVWTNFPLVDPPCPSRLRFSYVKIQTIIL